jgi:iron complex outermembrane receptor protein
VEYDQYPSEFFKNVVVYKSANAGLIAAGVSGTVDLRMLRPLAQKDRVIALQVRGQMNGIKALNPDGQQGLSRLGRLCRQVRRRHLGHRHRPVGHAAPSQNERYNAWGFPNEAAAGGALLLGGAKPYVQSNMLKRYGGVVTVEYRPATIFIPRSTCSIPVQGNPAPARHRIPDCPGMGLGRDDPAGLYHHQRSGHQCHADRRACGAAQ